MKKMELTIGEEFGEAIKLAIKFNKEHSGFLSFLNEVIPGSTIGLTISKPNGDENKVNLKVNESDIKLFNMLIEQEKRNLIIEVKVPDEDDGEDETRRR